MTISVSNQLLVMQKKLEENPKKQVGYDKMDVFKALASGDYENSVDITDEGIFTRYFKSAQDGTYMEHLFYDKDNDGRYDSYSFKERDSEDNILIMNDNEYDGIFDEMAVKCILEQNDNSCKSAFNVDRNMDGYFDIFSIRNDDKDYCNSSDKKQYEYRDYGYIK